MKLAPHKNWSPYLVDELFMLLSLFGDLHSLLWEDLSGLNRLFRQNLFGLSNFLENQAFPNQQGKTKHNPQIKITISEIKSKKGIEFGRTFDLSFNRCLIAWWNESPFVSSIGSSPLDIFAFEKQSFREREREKEREGEGKKGGGA